MGRPVRVAVVVVLFALSACSPDASEPIAPSSVAATTGSSPSPSAPTTTVTADTSAGYSVSSFQDGVEFEVDVLPVEDVELPPESLAPADGVDVTVRGRLTSPAELRLTLADAPSDQAMPMAWHIADDGSVEMVTGVWNEDSNQIVIATTEFSGWIPDWLNPVSWVAGVIDLVADSVTGRTDPPGCGEAAPEWASFVPPVGTGTVHSCFQSGVDQASGDVRAEVLFKSNRRGFQAVTVPAGAAYTWVEGQPDWLRPSLAWLTGHATTTNILLPGGMSTSFGFDQPELTTEAGIAVFTTPGTILMDGAMAALGILAGTDSSDLATVAVAVNSCALNVFGVDVLQGDTSVDFDVDTLLTSLLGCTLDTLPGLVDPQKATGAIVSLDDAHLLGAAPAGGRGEQIGMLTDSANRLGSIAERAAAAVALASAGVDLWDKILDNAIGNQPAHLRMGGYGGVDPASIELRSGGLGPVDFGSNDQSVIDYVAARVGNADSDTEYHFVPLIDSWHSVFGDHYAYGDGPDFAYRSFVAPHAREVCWRDELCLILGSDTGLEWVFMGWDYYVSKEDIEESRSALRATTSEGIGPGTSLGEIVERYPTIEVTQEETEVYQFTFPGWTRPSAVFNVGLEEFYDLEGIPASYFDPSLHLSRLKAGVEIPINIG